jgi:hypothetical protein
MNSICEICGGDIYLPAGVSDPGDTSSNPVVGCYGPHDEEIVDRPIAPVDPDFGPF